MDRLFYMGEVFTCIGGKECIWKHLILEEKDGLHYTWSKHFTYGASMR